MKGRTSLTLWAALALCISLQCNVSATPIKHSISLSAQLNNMEIDSDKRPAVTIEDGPVAYRSLYTPSLPPPIPQPEPFGMMEVDISDDGLRGSLILSGSSDMERKDPSEFMVYALGDLHGDYNTTANLLKSINLINEEGEWCSDSSYLIQLGDIADRGPDSLALFELFYQLAGASDGRGFLLQMFLTTSYSTHWKP
jgi:hypothetical protein